MPEERPSTEEITARLREYWRQSRRPLVSLVFISPLLLIYEGGVLLQGSDAMRNGADAWLRMFLNGIGFGQYFLLPLLTVGVLLGWHHVNREPWSVPRWVLTSMAGECVSLALVLVVIAYAQAALLNALLPGASLGTLLPIGNALTRLISQAISYCGAGIYEEVLFRLILLTALVGVFKLAGAKPVAAVWGGIGISSLLFSLAHYVGVEGDDFTIYSFLFRFVAGAFFAILFARRGFGIAAGTHALYDILVGLLMVARL